MRPLAAASWDDLVAVDLQGLPRNVVEQARPVVNSPWLRDVDVELVDTPGSAGLDDQHMLTLEALAHCDAALLTIAAIDRTHVSRRRYPSARRCAAIGVGGILLQPGVLVLSN
jgi:hypothetical protein